MVFGSESPKSPHGSWNRLDGQKCVSSTLSWDDVWSSLLLFDFAFEFDWIMGVFELSWKSKYRRYDRSWSCNSVLHAEHTYLSLEVLIDHQCGRHWRSMRFLLHDGSPDFVCVKKPCRWSSRPFVRIFGSSGTLALPRFGTCHICPDWVSVVDLHIA